MLILSNGLHDSYLDKVKATAQQLNEVGLKVQAKKYKFTALELEYLDYAITQESIKPICKKVEVIIDIKLLKIVK